MVKKRKRKGSAVRKDKKKDRDLLLMVSLFITSAALLIGIIWFLLNPVTTEQPPVSESLSTNLPSKSYGGEGVITKGNIKSAMECLKDYGIDKNAVVFIYSTQCPYSRSMEPAVSQLENEGYKFFWLNVENGTALQIVSECLSGIADLSGTPEFVCAATNRSKVSTMSIDELRLFAESCR